MLRWTLRRTSLPWDVWGGYDGNIEVKSCTLTLPSGIFQAKSHIFFHSSPPLALLQTKSLFLSGWLCLCLCNQDKKKLSNYVLSVTGYRLPVSLSSTDDLGWFWPLHSAELSLIMSSPSPAGDWESDKSLLTALYSTHSSPYKHHLSPLSPLLSPNLCRASPPITV